MTAVPGQVAVETDAAAHHVVAGGRKGDGAGRVGGVQDIDGDTRLDQLGHQRVEAGDLLRGVELVLPVAVGHREVGPHALEPQRGLVHDRA